MARRRCRRDYEDNKFEFIWDQNMPGNQHALNLLDDRLKTDIELLNTILPGYKNFPEGFLLYDKSKKNYPTMLDFYQGCI